MGKKVNIVLPGGKVVSVDEAAANEGTFRREAPSEAYQASKDDVRSEEHSGVLSTLAAGAEGALDAATLGIGGRVEKAVGGEEFAHDYEARAQEHPTARTIGELATVAAPTGLLGKVAKGATELSLAGQASRLGKLGAAGAVAEGGLLGMGAQVASTNVTGDPLTVEGMVKSATVGGLLGFGFERIGSGLQKWGAKAKAAKAEADAIAAVVPEAQAGAKVFSESNPHYDNFVSAVKAQKSAEQEAYGTVKKANEVYTKWADSTEEFGKAVGDFQKSQNKIRSEYINRSSIKDLEYMEKHGLSFDEMIAQKEMAGEFLDKMQADLDEAIKMKRQAGRPSDPAGNYETLRDQAINKLHDVRGKLSQTFPDVPVPDMPRIPPKLSSVMDPLAADLPKNLRDFSRKTPEKISELGRNMNEDAHAAFGRVTEDLGLELKANPEENFSAVWKKLGDYRSAIDRVEARAAAEGAKASAGGALPWLRRAAKNAAVNAAGFGVFQGVGGGMMGAAAGSAARVAVKTGTDAIEDTLLGGIMVSEKLGLRSTIRDTVAKYAIPSGSALKKLGPVTAYLSRSFPDGTPDTSSIDVRRHAANRVGDLATTMMSGHDAMFLAVENMLGHPGDIGAKVANHVMGAVAYLHSAAPKDPGTNLKMFKSNWTPSWEETMALAHRMEAALDPVASLTRALTGGGHPAGTEALWSVWPAMMNELAQEVSMSADKLQELTYRQISSYSSLFRCKLSGLQDPDVFMSIQSMYMPKPETAGPSAGGKPGFGRNSGRPASVGSNPVVGSSVSGLTGN